MNYRALFQHVEEWFSILFHNLVNYFKSKKELRQENIALRSQLALFIQVETGKRPKPKATLAFRQIMVLLSKRYANWRSSLALFKPETVIKWQKTAFKFHWLKKSKRGRPKISPKTIALIKQIHDENPLLSPECQCSFENLHFWPKFIPFSLPFTNACSG